MLAPQQKFINKSKGHVLEYAHGNVLLVMTSKDVLYAMAIVKIPHIVSVPKELFSMIIFQIANINSKIAKLIMVLLR